ncbi:TRCF domain-containing protein, partial [Gemmiger formicilis]|uniref:TRCF domain-containing protein n=1 Tax=Gemmiger formicilis TaxID=745368 RepID=UPI001FAEFC3E
ETPPPDKSDCLVDISIDAYLPEDYIPDPAGRIEAYKRIFALLYAQAEIGATQSVVQHAVGILVHHRGQLLRTY